MSLAFWRMTPPDRFRQEIEKVRLRQDGSTRHLVLLGNEGLYLWERWRTLRHSNLDRPGLERDELRERKAYIFERVTYRLRALAHCIRSEGTRHMTRETRMRGPKRPTSL